MPRVLFILSALCLAQLSWGDGFSDWLNRDAESFRNYTSKEEKAFQEFLRREWVEFEAFKGEQLYEKPKFPRQPVLNSTDKKHRDTRFTSTGLRTSDQSGGVSRFLDYSYRGLPSVVIELYGVSLRFPEPKKRIPRIDRADNRGLADFYEKMGEINLDQLLQSLGKARTELNLGDWGLAKLIYGYAESTVGPTREEAYPLTWYLLQQAGYDARIAFDGTSGGIYLMLPVDEPLYGMPYARLDDKNFYFVDLGPEKRQPDRFFTYPQGFPSAGTSMQLSVSALPRLPHTRQSRELSFEYQGHSYSLTLEYDKGVIDYFRDFPQGPFGAYLSSGTSEEFSAAVLETLHPLLRGASETEAANLLLRMVQNAFAYRTDQDQFAREKWMLPEETVYYPYSDCDDRAILFSWLVTRLLDLPVIGVQWPGHMATAVAFSTPPADASFTYKSQKWTICDPTYSGADIGMVMPVYAGREFRIIEQKDVRY